MNESSYGHSKTPAGQVPEGTRHLSMLASSGCSRSGPSIFFEDRAFFLITLADVNAFTQEACKTPNKTSCVCFCRHHLLSLILKGRIAFSGLRTRGRMGWRCITGTAPSSTLAASPSKKEPTPPDLHPHATITPINLQP